MFGNSTNILHTFYCRKSNTEYFLQYQLILVNVEHFLLNQIVRGPIPALLKTKLAKIAVDKGANTDYNLGHNER